MIVTPHLPIYFPQIQFVMQNFFIKLWENFRLSFDVCLWKVFFFVQPLWMRINCEIIIWNIYHAVYVFSVLVFFCWNKIKRYFIYMAFQKYCVFPQLSTSGWKISSYISLCEMIQKCLISKENVHQLNSQILW